MVVADEHVNKERIYLFHLVSYSHSEGLNVFKYSSHRVHMKRQLVVQGRSASLQTVSQQKGPETLKRSVRNLKEELQNAF